MIEVNTGTASIISLWHAARIVYPQFGPRAFIYRLRYVKRALNVGSSLSALLDASPDSALGRFVESRPQVLGFVEAPFIHAGWDGRTCLETFLRQFALHQTLGRVFAFDPSHSIEVLELEFFGPDYLVVMDKPAWFQREGMLTLNIFRENLRLISVCFSFDTQNDELIVMVGAVQGRRIDGALEEYRQLTKLAHGMRPRDLLIDMVRIIASTMGAKRMVAISDACRHHRSPYFGRDIDRALSLDYDEIWRDRGGEPLGDGFFAVPLERQERDIEDIPSKKRQMYSKRYAMMNEIETRIRATLRDIEPVIRPEAD